MMITTSLTITVIGESPTFWATLLLTPCYPFNSSLDRYIIEFVSQPSFPIFRSFPFRNQWDRRWISHANSHSDSLGNTQLYSGENSRHRHEESNDSVLVAG